MLTYDKETVKQALSSIGYSLIFDSNGWRSNAIYRNGNNRFSLKINEDGTFKDFKTGRFGTLDQLIALTVGKDNVKKYLNEADAVITENEQEEKEYIQFMANLDKSLLRELTPKYDYWLNRGISKELIEKFQGGECYKQKRFFNRYVFPIFGATDNLVGLSGRLLGDDPEGKFPKWKHYGGKSEWKYPLFLNYKLIKKEKSVIVVESIGDCLSLMEKGIYNVVVSFGLDISFSLENVFLRYQLEKVIIAFNNDENQRGNIAAEKMKKRMDKFFPRGSIKIGVPEYVGKDFNDLLLENPDYIDEWHKKLKL